jgi:hypothetical protein
MQPTNAQGRGALDPDDRRFHDAFEACTLRRESFRHRDHVRLGWIYLRLHGMPEALRRFSTALRRYAEAQGHAGLYHETITWAYLFLIHERLQQLDIGTSERFVEAHPELLSRDEPILQAYYSTEKLGSDLARHSFVLPDLVAPRPAIAAAGPDH